MFFLDQGNYNLTRNSTAICEQEESVSIAPSFKQKIVSVFTQSGTKNKVPQKLQLDEVVEVDADLLKNVEKLTLTFWKSKEAFDFVHSRT